MPELPEMQALAERLDALLAGASLDRADPLQFSAAKTAEPPLTDLHGREVTTIGRRGKFLVTEFGGPRLLIHLSQGGRVDVEDPPKTTRPKGAVLRLRFAGKPSVLIKEYGTQRKAGWWTLAEGDDGPLERLGPEPGTPAFNEIVLRGADPRRVHTMLRDQRTVAGIGRGHVDDILHRAGLSPYVMLKKLDDAARAGLLAAIDSVIEEALAHERTRTGGLPTKLSDRFIVHRRHGEPCPKCGDELKRVWYESYEVTYCPACQTGGKVLADRRLSRIVR